VSRRFALLADRTQHSRRDRSSLNTEAAEGALHSSLPSNDGGIAIREE
jgi:hypothetical protein